MPPDGEATRRNGRWPLGQAPESTAEARAAAHSFLRASVARADEDAVLLVITELVANAVQHGQEPIELRLALSPGCVHVEVDDAGSRPPVMGAPTADGESGRGLFIVSSLGQWGCTPIEGSGKTVWCDVDAVAAVGGR